MIKYQSETIQFEITIPQWAQDTERVVVYAYTHRSFVSKHSIDPADGYNLLEQSGESKLIGTIPSEDTKKMQGALYMDVMVVKSNGKRYIDSKTTEITIENKPISQEE